MCANTALHRKQRNPRSYTILERGLLEPSSFQSFRKVPSGAFAKPINTLNIFPLHLRGKRL